MHFWNSFEVVEATDAAVSAEPEPDVHALFLTFKPIQKAGQSTKFIIRPFRWYLLSSSLVLCLTLFLATDSFAAEPKNKAVLIDGLSVLAGGIGANESDSVSVLLSDVEFEAVLLLLRKLGPSTVQRDIEDGLRIQARRHAVLVRLLARQAKQLKENTNAGEVADLRNKMIERAGGTKAIEKLYKNYGVGENALIQWAENALLAATQIKYIKEQVDAPSDKEIVERLKSRFGSTDGEARKELYDTYRQMILKEQTDDKVRGWLLGILAESRVRIIR